MSNIPKKKVWMRPDQHWCKRDGRRQRVTLDRCSSCDHRNGCTEYGEALANLDEDEPATTELSDCGKNALGAQGGQDVQMAEKETLSGGADAHSNAAGSSEGDGSVRTGESDSNVQDVQRNVISTTEITPHNERQTAVGRKTVALSVISIDGSLYPRKKTDPDNIERLRGIGPVFNTPIVVSEDMRLVDGRHRATALELDGITEVEVLIYRYTSDEALLEHAVKLNCQHGLQLTREEKQAWLTQSWSPSADKKRVAGILGVSIRTVERWTKDVRELQRREERDLILDCRSEGNSIAETAALSGKSVATVKRVAQERQMSQIGKAQTKRKSDEAPGLLPLEHSRKEEGCPAKPKPEPGAAGGAPVSVGDAGYALSPQKWSESTGKQKVQDALRILRDVREWHRSASGPRVFLAIYFYREIGQLVDELANWGCEEVFRFLEHRRIMAKRRKRAGQCSALE